MEEERRIRVKSVGNIRYETEAFFSIIYDK